MGWLARGGGVSGQRHASTVRRSTAAAICVGTEIKPDVDWHGIGGTGVHPTHLQQPPSQQPAPRPWLAPRPHQSSACRRCSSSLSAGSLQGAAAGTADKLKGREQRQRWQNWWQTGAAGMVEARMGGRESSGQGHTQNCRSMPAATPALVGCPPVLSQTHLLYQQCSEWRPARHLHSGWQTHRHTLRRTACQHPRIQPCPARGRSRHQTPQTPWSPCHAWNPALP